MSLARLRPYRAVAQIRNPLPLLRRSGGSTEWQAPGNNPVTLQLPGVRLLLGRGALRLSRGPLRAAEHRVACHRYHINQMLTVFSSVRAGHFSVHVSTM